MTEVGNWILVALTAQMLIFTVLYGGRSRWWTNPVGRVFFPEKVLMCCVLVQVSLSAVTQSTYPYRDEARILLYGAGFLALVWMTAMLLIIQSRDRRDARRRAIRQARRGDHEDDLTR